MEWPHDDWLIDHDVRDGRGASDASSRSWPGARTGRALPSPFAPLFRKRWVALRRLLLRSCRRWALLAPLGLPLLPLRLLALPLVQRSKGSEHPPVPHAPSQEVKELLAAEELGAELEAPHARVDGGLRRAEVRLEVVGERCERQIHLRRRQGSTYA